MQIGKLDQLHTQLHTRCRMCPNIPTRADYRWGEPIENRQFRGRVNIFKTAASNSSLWSPHPTRCRLPEHVILISFTKRTMVTATWFRICTNMQQYGLLFINIGRGGNLGAAASGDPFPPEYVNACALAHGII